MTVTNFLTKVQMKISKLEGILTVGGHEKTFRATLSHLRIKAAKY